MRLFLAIRLSDKMQKSLIGVMHDLKQKGVKGNYIPASNLHITLCFIGETGQAAEIQEAMAAIPSGSFRISLDGAGNFGDLLWVGVKGGQKLKACARAFGTALDAAGIAYDKKKLVPHITVIRGMKGAKPGDLAVPKTEQTVESISLMKSEQKNGKTVYTEIASVKL